jgi:hypothetical protein
MATAKDCHTLTSYYEKKYKEIYNIVPNVNRVTARWNFDSILGASGVSVATVKEMLDYYFTTPKDRRHSLDWFFYNYDKLVKAMADAKKDREDRQRLMEESKIRAERWRQSGKPTITDD